MASSAKEQKVQVRKCNREFQIWWTETQESLSKGEKVVRVLSSGIVEPLIGSLRMKPYHDPAEQIETEDIPPKESYKGPITRSRIKTLEQNDSGALSSFSRGAMPHA
ncbi:hypothetical protein TNCV_3341681 [Trichonephila clavipes]|nr:hypothetical protein TNCV_3341681 [Trichonephila clavipes]